jgi:hypothetical protein
MLRLERHLTEDELLALRDGRDDDFTRVSHLEGCSRCQKRLGFLSAFKAAAKTSLESGPPAPRRGPKAGSRSRPEPDLKSEVRPGSTPELAQWIHRSTLAETEEPGADEDFISFSSRSDALTSAPSPAAQSEIWPPPPSAPPPKPAEEHPDPATLAAYFDGALKGRERSRVQRHLLGCERCMADTLVLVAGRGEGDAGSELRAARTYFREHGSAIAYPPRSSREVRPQLDLGLQDGIGTEVDFRILARPGRTSRPRLPSRDVDDRVEIMIGTVRVTVTAHRDARARFLDVQVRDLGRPAFPPAATVSLEDEGRRIGSVHTDPRGKASMRVPDLPSFDLRIKGGWTIPVLLRFRA